MFRILLFLFMPGLALSQPASLETSDFEITYQTLFNKMFDRDQEYVKFRSLLLIRNEHSLFYMLPDQAAENRDDELNITIQKDTLFRVGKNMDTEQEVFSDLTLHGKEVYYRDTLYPMTWKLSAETKMIDSLLCQKAETFFRGRNYIAWYCPSIPIANGPWKLGGLPGLIIEVADTQRDLHFQLTAIKRVTDWSAGPNFINMQDRYPEYPAFQKYWRDMGRKLNGMMAAREDPNCLSCQTAAKTVLHSWEKIPQQ